MNNHASWIGLVAESWNPTQGHQDAGSRIGVGWIRFGPSPWRRVADVRGRPGCLRRPTFPGLFLGAAAGLLAAHLPGFSETPVVAVLMAAAAVSILRLPLSATVIALLLTSKAGIATGPLIIVAVVVAYLTIQTLSATRRPPALTAAGAPAAEPRPAAPAPPHPQITATVRHDHQAP
jgi:hypothetical protein